MARKHNTKHRRSPSNYPKRLEARGLNRTPVMRWTGMTTDQISRTFANLPHYRWVRHDDVDANGKKIGSRYVRMEIR